MPRVSVWIPKRLLALVDDLANRTESTRSALLGQIFTLGLRAYVDLYKRGTGVLASKQDSHDSMHR